jgi:hypothetical protein
VSNAKWTNIEPKNTGCKKTFKIPLISAIIGLLIPQSQFVLLPLKALDGLLM